MKGSVLSYIKSCLLMAKKLMLYFTNLIKITERILIDNKFVDDEIIITFAASKIEKLYFEFMTVCAYFI